MSAFLHMGGSGIPPGIDAKRRSS